MKKQTAQSAFQILDSAGLISGAWSGMVLDESLSETQELIALLRASQAQTESAEDLAKAIFVLLDQAGFISGAWTGMEWDDLPTEALEALRRAAQVLA